MPRTPTGRPPGRPKSPMGYTTLMCRLPTDKAERIVETARQRQITVSALLREALDTWLQTHPPQTRLFTSTPEQLDRTEPMKTLVETTRTVGHPGGTFHPQITAPTRGFAQPVLPTERDNRQTETIPGADSRQTTTGPSEDKCQTKTDADKRMTETAPKTDSCMTETGTEADNCQTETTPGAQAIPPEACPPFDAVKFVLGRLCPNKHEWGTTGQSLLSLRSRNCSECRNAYKREKRAAQRQPAQP